MPKRCAWRVGCMLLVGAASAVVAVAQTGASPHNPDAPSLAQRLAGVAQAAQQHLDKLPGDAARYPPELMRVAWLTLAGDTLPDALLVLKPRKDECAALASSRSPCRALLMRGQPNGSYQVFTEFTPRVHPAVFRDSGVGAGQDITELHHARDTDANAAYRGYSLLGEAPEPLPVPPANATPMAQWRGLAVDDRSLPLLAEQVYAARHFDNAAARLAPFRLHFDGINASLRRLKRQPLVYDSAFEQRAAALVDGLAPELSRVVAGIGWTQTLEVRLWSCVDWMVPRRFWEVESRRLGKIGFCIEPLVLGLNKGIVKSGSDYLAAARYRLLQQIGLAFVLRQAPLTLAERERLKTEAAAAQLLELGTAAGLLLGQGLGLQTLPGAAHAHALWQQLAELWFREFEVERKLFVIPSPELLGFAQELATMDQVLRCLANTKPTQDTKEAACGPTTREHIELARSWVRSLATP